MDIVVFGASGFTGRLVAEYLVKAAPPGVRVGLGGRDREKLESTRASLAALDPRAADCPILLADSQDRGALDRLAGQTRVVCTTVGPYAWYGRNLVAACAAGGTHYCDLSGEVPFIRSMIDDYDAEARASGAHIVHSCGFDSIPSDLGCLMMAEALVREGARPTSVRLFAGETKGGFSGGTVASMLTILEDVASHPDTRRLVLDPYALNPSEERSGPDLPDQSGVRFDPALQSWTGPFMMAGINTRIVRRSHALRGWPYGRDFRYSECMSTGRSAAGWFRAWALAGGVSGLVLAGSIKPLRQLLARRLLPQPGHGPSKEARESGYFVCRLTAEGQTESGELVQLRGEVRGDGDPGYTETAKMLGEAGLCLAVDGSKLDRTGGSLTPASSMGFLLIERLRRAGITFSVDAR